MVNGTFTSTGVQFNLSIPSGYNKIELYNITDLGSSASNTDVMYAVGTSSMPAGAANYWPKTSGAATFGTGATISSGGFTFLSDSATTAIGSSVVTTSVTQASPAVVATGTTTSLVAASSVVRLFGQTGMQQLSGMDFTVGTISASTSFQLAYLISSGFAAAATTGSYRIINATSRYYPRSRYITAISVATSAVITLSVTHGYTAGQSVRIYVPSAFGMTQINGLLGNITAINTTTNTITVDIDSSAFTAFAFPTSAIAAAGVTFAQVVPVGEDAVSTYANLLDDATDNQSLSGVTVGTTVQTSGVLYQWIASRGVSI
jgi:hypothetical protein